MTSTDDPGKEGLRPPARRGWRWFWYLLLGLAIYASGLATGAGIMTIVAQREEEYARKHPEEAPKRLAKRLQGALDLDPRQTRQVEQVLADRWSAMQKIRNRVYPQFEEEFNLLEKQVDGVLRPEQRPAWKEYFESYRNRWRGAPESQPAQPGIAPR